MLVESFNPFGNLLLSSLIAAIPIILFLLCLTVFKMKGIYAAITTLVVTLLIAIPFFKLPVGIASGAVVEGFFQGIFPIGYIVIMAVLLYKITLKSAIRNYSRQYYKYFTRPKNSASFNWFFI